MFKENKLATILFIVIFTCLFGLLIYTPFYLKEYKQNQHKYSEKSSDNQEETTPNIEPKESTNQNPPVEEKDEQKNAEEDESKESDKKEELEKINLNLTIEVNGQKYPATLEDNPTSRAFIKKLPLELKMSELNGNEKYYKFSEVFPSNPTAVKNINKGDLMLYGEDTIVLFYDTFETPYEYTKIANISDEDNGMLKTNLGKKEAKVKFYQ